MSENKTHTAWTPSQEQAIFKNGVQLLIAAGAGSGKTSVLTQRILEKVLLGCDIDSFLVVTYTVASAEDMKEKLRKKLLEKYAEDTGNKHLSNQIAKLPFAQISTITSFCLKLVKQNFASLNIPSGARIADEGEAIELFESSVDLLLDECFDSDDESLHKLLRLSACKGNENCLADYLSYVYGKIRAHPNYLKKISALSKSFSEYALSASDVSSLFRGEAGELIENTVDYICALPVSSLRTMEEMGEHGGETLSEITRQYVAYFEQGIALAKEHKFQESSEAFKNAYDLYTNGWKKVRLSKILEAEEKSAYEELKKSTREIAGMARDFFCDLNNEGVNDAKLCAEIMEALTKMIIRLDEIFSSAKAEKGILDFTDAEQLAHKLLIDENGGLTTLCKEISAGIEEVLVDEYQDTNPLQDAIFAALANKNNRFMVGDDKQSIYRFRNAYPDIFNAYKKSFITDKAQCIFLRENFRCSEKVIDFTNGVFNFLWGDEYKKEELIFSKKSPSPASDDVVVKTFITSLKNKESSVYEARYIANEILNLKKTYLKEDGAPLNFSDIAVMLPVAKDITDIFIEEFRKKGIPASSAKQGLLISTPEVKLMLSILKAINNPEEDVPLASAMNSFFFGFTADDLSKIRKFKESSLWGSVLNYFRSRKVFPRLKLKCKKTVSTVGRKKHLTSKTASIELKGKCRNFARRLLSFREKSRTMECKQLIWELLENEGILAQIERENDAEIKKGNLLLLYSEAISFGRKEYKTLSSFLKHCEKLTAQTYSPEGIDSVSIMTIHASKGLEFPICFLANAGRSLTAKGFGALMPILQVKTGVFTPLRFEEFSSREPIFYQCAEILEKPDNLAEEKRKLYVAMTRAKEKLYIVGSSPEKYSLKNSSPDDDTNYLSWILTARPEGIYLEENLDVKEEDGFEAQDEAEAFSPNDVSEQDFADEDDDEDFVYPYENEINIPRKLSVSELKKSADKEYEKSIRKSNFLTVPSFAAETKAVSATEIGTANHTFMQFASFENCIKLGVEYEAERLLITDMLTNEQYGMLNFKSLKEFFKSELWGKIKKSPAIYREKRFTVSDNSGKLLGVGNETVLVQGVIDLFFENEDGTYTVVDYKTDKARLGDEQILAERYKNQISYYAKAVREITGKEVSLGMIYSFALNKEIPVDLT